MIAVKVRDQYRVDLRRVDPKTSHRHECRGSTVYEEPRALVPDVDASLKSATAPENVAATQKPDVDLFAHTPPVKTRTLSVDTESVLLFLIADYS